MAEQGAPTKTAATRSVQGCENGNHTVACQYLAATEEKWGGCLSKRVGKNGK